MTVHFAAYSGGCIKIFNDGTEVAEIPPDKVAALLLEAAKALKEQRATKPQANKNAPP